MNSVKTSKTSLWMSVVAMSVAGAWASATPPGQVPSFETPERLEVSEPNQADSAPEPPVPEPSVALILDEYVRHAKRILVDQREASAEVYFSLADARAMPNDRSLNPVFRSAIAACKVHEQQAQAALRQLAAETEIAITALGASKDDKRLLSAMAKERAGWSKNTLKHYTSGMKHGVSAVR